MIIAKALELAEAESRRQGKKLDLILEDTEKKL
jgi:hypothetical protein